MGRLVIYEACSDNTAVVMDIYDMSQRFCSEEALIKLGSGSEPVFGLDVFKRKIQHLSSTDVSIFPSSDEAFWYKREHSLSGTIVETPIGAALLRKSNRIMVVAYLVGCVTEVDKIYVGEQGYTSYEVSAKLFNKRDAQRIAGIMTHKSKTGKIWRAIRFPLGLQS